VFHFFFVIFHPEQYPMSFAWITGRVTEESVKHHHPKWYRRMFMKKNGDTNKEQGNKEEK
jgi:cytochrome b subunit of formate dehydrogenase